MKVIVDEQVKAMAEAFKLGKENIINFRHIFLPAPNESSPAWFHYEWDKILREGNKHFAIQAFRESAKTAIVIRAHILYRLVYPSTDYDYIVLIKANQREASKKLKEITYEYINNPVLRGNLVKIREQTERIFEVEVKDDSGNIINVRIEAFGKGAAIRGLSYAEKRPRLLVLDDVQDITDSQSETIQDTDYEWFLSDVYFLGKSSRIFMIGNNLGEQCLISRIFAGAEDLGFDIMTVPILDTEGKSNWDSYWPTDKVLEEKERWNNLGLMNIWYREKMCIAIAPDSQLFRKDDFRYFDKNNLDIDGYSVYTTVDLAISEKESADYSVVMTVAVSPENHWFILDCQYGRWNPTKTMDKIFEAVQKYRPIFVGIEKVAYQASLLHFLQKEMPQRNCFFVIKPLIADKKKELRIQQLQPRFTTGTVWFPMGTSFLTELETQLLAFPKGLHDDLPDALGYVEQVALPPVGAWSNAKNADIPYAGAL